MYFDCKVKIPEVKGKIYERTIKGVVYINYEYDRIYKPDKKYNIPKRTTIGKKCEDDPEMMYPNPNFLTPVSSVLATGLILSNTKYSKWLRYAVPYALPLIIFSAICIFVLNSIGWTGV